MESTGIIIVAGGSGRRAGGVRPKQFAFLAGVPVLARTINNFAAAMPGAEIVAVLPEQHIEFWKNLAARFDVAAHTVAAGGAERFDSVKNGLAALTTGPELIAVQDGVRPLGTAGMIRRVAAAAALHGAAKRRGNPTRRASYPRGSSIGAGCASCRPRSSSAPRCCAAPTRRSTARNSPTTPRWSKPPDTGYAWPRASAEI